MRKIVFYGVFTVILILALIGLFIARQNFNSQYSAASQAIQVQQGQVIATAQQGG